MQNSYRKGIVCAIIFLCFVSSSYPIINGKNIGINTDETHYNKESVNNKEYFSININVWLVQVI